MKNPLCYDVQVIVAKGRVATNPLDVGIRSVNLGRTGVFSFV